MGSTLYWYRDHLTGGKKKKETVSRESFIGRMVQHILPKGFQRIRYYGLQATCVLKKVREQLTPALPGARQLVLETVVEPVKRLSYRERMKQTLGRDPQRCQKCGAELWLWEVWHPKYGLVFDEAKRIQQGVYETHERSLPRVE
jgi:hypothetical protein